jgi:hypothetical protein
MFLESDVRLNRGGFQWRHSDAASADSKKTVDASLRSALSAEKRRRSKKPKNSRNQSWTVKKINETDPE